MIKNVEHADIDEPPLCREQSATDSSSRWPNKSIASSNLISNSRDPDFGLTTCQLMGGQRVSLRKDDTFQQYAYIDEPTLAGGGLTSKIILNSWNPADALSTCLSMGVEV